MISQHAHDVTAEVHKLVAEPEQQSGVNRFPAEVFPPIIQEYAKELAEHYACPSQVTYSALIVAAGVCLGNNVEIFNKQEWREAANFYMCAVGPKGSGKSHGPRIVFKPLNRKDTESYKAHVQAMAAWEARKHAAKGTGEPFDEPQPVFDRLTIDSATIEKLFEILKENQRGIIVISDEIRGWFKSIFQYDSDNLDKWLRIFNRDTIQVDRMSRQTTIIPAPFVSVFGTIQPDVLERILTPDMKDSGLMDRMLFVTVDPKIRFADGDVSPDLLAEWDSIVGRLLNVAPDTGCNIHLSAEARKVFTDWQKNHIAQLNENETERQLGGKWENYLLRFALVIHCLHKMESSISSEVSASTVQGAIAMTKFYQKEYYKVVGEKDSYLVRQMSESHKDIYKALPGEFLTSQGVSIARDHDMSERTFKRWLNDKRMFKFMRHGQYEKLLEL